MVPPQPLLSWESVIAAVNLADFDLLKSTRQDIRKLDWAQPANREGMVMYFKIKRAKEEIIRLNVEIRRLLTFLYDDHVDHYRAVCANIITDPTLAFEVSTRSQYRNKIHEEIVKRLLQTSRLPGFSGSLFHGERQGRDPSLNVDVPPPLWITGILGITQVGIEVMEKDDEVTIGDTDLGVDVDTDAFISLLEDVSLQ
jgi:Holliday junction resolvase